jgi:ABC-type spermidine/putrescine transport system permease subunit I
VVGEFVIPELLGGSSTQMIGRTLWSEFFQNRDWPIASAVAVLPMKIFSSVRLGVTPEINAIATILIGLVATGTVIYSLMLKRAAAQRIRAEQAMKG